MIQITWKSNYEKYFKHLGNSAWISTPQKVAQDLKYSVDSAGWYWRFGSAWGDMNTKANNDDFISVSIGVNGGLNGFTHRKKNLKKIIRKMNIQNECINLNVRTIGTYKFAKSAIRNSNYGKRNKTSITAFDD